MLFFLFVCVTIFISFLFALFTERSKKQYGQCEKDRIFGEAVFSRDVRGGEVYVRGGSWVGGDTEVSVRVGHTRFNCNSEDRSYLHSQFNESPYFNIGIRMSIKPEFLSMCHHVRESRFRYFGWSKCPYQKYFLLHGCKYVITLRVPFHM